MWGRLEYEPIAAKHRVPIVITGFEPLDLLEGVLRTVTQPGRGAGRRSRTQYGRAVRLAGNPEVAAN